MVVGVVGGVGCEGDIATVDNLLGEHTVAVAGEVEHGDNGITGGDDIDGDEVAGGRLEGDIDSHVMVGDGDSPAVTDGGGAAIDAPEGTVARRGSGVEGDRGASLQTGQTGSRGDSTVGTDREGDVISIGGHGVSLEDRRYINVRVNIIICTGVVSVAISPLGEVVAFVGARRHGDGATTVDGVGRCRGAAVGSIANGNGVGIHGEGGSQCHSLGDVANHVLGIVAAVAPLHEAVAVVGSSGEGGAAAVAHAGGADAGAAAVTGVGGESIGVERKLGRHIDILVHIAVGAGVRCVAIVPLCEGCASGGSGRHGDAATAVDRRGRCRGAAIGGGADSDSVGLNSEGGGQALSLGDIVDSIFSIGVSVAPLHEAVASVGSSCEGGAAAVVHAGGADAGGAALTCGGGESIGVDGKLGRHIDVLMHIAIGAGVVSVAVVPLGEVVASVGGRRHGDVATTVDTSGRCRGAAVGGGADGDGVGIQGEVSRKAEG